MVAVVYSWSMHLALLVLWAVLAVSAVPTLAAQDSDVARLEQEVAGARGAERAERLLELSEAVRREDPVRAAALADEALELAGDARDTPLLARAEYLAGDLALAGERFEAAAAHFEAARQGFAEVGDDGERMRALRRLGDAEYRLAQYDVALGHFTAALELARTLTEAGDESFHVHQAHLATMVGNVFFKLEDVPKALEYYQQALAVYRDLGEEEAVAGTAVNIGNLEQKDGRLEAALAAFRQAREVAAAAGNDYLLEIALANSGSVLIELGRTDEADRAIAAAEEVSARTGRELGRLHLLLLRGRLEMGRGQPAAAEDAYRRADDLADRLETRDQLADALLGRADALEALGRPGEALAALRRHVATRSEIADRERTESIRELETRYRAETARHELEMLRAEQRRERLERRILLAALAVALVVVAGLWHGLRTRARRAAELAQTTARLEEAYRRMDELARTDTLTGLPNRRDFGERLAMERARSERNGRPFVLALADLDGFKRVNDELGHDCGDEVLRDLATQLRRLVRAQDYAARWGGDELVLLLPDTDLAGGAVLAEKIRAEIARRGLETGRGRERLTLSIGLAEGDGAASADDLLHEADRALHAAKTAGRDRVERG